MMDALSGKGGQHRELPDSFAGRCKDSGADRGSRCRNWGFACPGRWNVSIVEKYDFDLRQVGKAWHTICRQPAIQNSSSVEVQLFEERASDALNDCAFDLVGEYVGVN